MEENKTGMDSQEQGGGVSPNDNAVGVQPSPSLDNAGEVRQTPPPMENAGEAHQTPPVGNAGGAQQTPPPMYNMGNQQQAAFSYQGMGVMPPSQEQQPKKKGPVAAIILVCVLIVALAAGAVVLGISLFSSPKQKVIKAIGTTIADQDHFLADYLGIEEIAKMTSGGKYSSELELYLEEIEEEYYDYSMLSGAGIRSQSNVDYESRKAVNNIQIVYNGADLISMDLFANDAVVGMGLPDFYDGYLALNTESIVEDYNKSYLSKSSGEKIDEEMGFNIFEMSPKDNGDAFRLQYAVDLKNAYEAVEVSKTEEKRTASIDGKDLVCTGYEVRIPQETAKIIIDDIFEYLETASEDSANNYTQMHEFFTEILDEDLIYMIYLDKRGRMLACEYAYDVTYEDDTINCTVDLAWAGSSHLWDDFSCDITMTDPERENTIIIAIHNNVTRAGTEARQQLDLKVNDGEEWVAAEYKASLDMDTGDTRMRIIINSDEEEAMKIDLQGAFQKVKAGKQYKFDMDSLTCALQDESMVFTLSGSYALGALKEPVEIQEDNIRYLLKMDQDDYYELGEEIEDNFLDSPLLSMLLGNAY